jgi:glycosyltransferase involved in cell wall biosynthesis
MRLLFLNHNVVRRGGTYFRAFQAARHLAARDHQVRLLAISSARRWGFEREVRQGVEIIHTPDLLWGGGRSGWDAWDTAWRMLHLRGQTWDIIHAWDCRPVVILPALYARRRSRRAGGKLVIDWCDWWGRGGTQAERPDSLLKRLYAPIETYFEEAFRTRADGSTVISQPLRERARRLGVPADRLWLLPQGCEVDGPAPPDRGAARRRLGLALDRPVAVSLGALTRSETGLLAEGVKLLRVRRPECQVVVVGRIQPEQQAVWRARPEVIQTGEVSEAALADYIAASDALLTPLADTVASRARWPSKVNSFLAAGRTTVMTAVGDLAELLARERAAVVTPCSPEGLVAGLESLLDQPELQAACERNAWRVARDLLAWPRLAEQLETIYGQVRGEGATALAGMTAEG